MFDCFLMLTLSRDHAGGNEELKELVPGIKVYGGSKDNVKGCTDSVENGDKISLGADVNILSLHTPWYGTTVLCFFLLFCVDICFRIYILFSLINSNPGITISLFQIDYGKTSGENSTSYKQLQS